MEHRGARLGSLIGASVADAQLWAAVAAGFTLLGLAAYGAVAGQRVEESPVDR